jgi:hypothetical protein
MPADTRGLVFFRAQWEEWFEQTDRVIENHPLVVHDDTNDKLKVRNETIPIYSLQTTAVPPEY